MRIGLGNDLHRLEVGRPLFLGGIRIPSKKGEIATSDGDVLIHALIDAILGAFALGDIGTFFPPDTKEYNGIDSKELLKIILEKTKPIFINIDSVVTLEKPKLLPYVPQIKESLSKLLNLSLEKISVKAKTNEGLGEIGRGEAIKAEVIILLKEN